MVGWSKIPSLGTHFLAWTSHHCGEVSAADEPTPTAVKVRAETMVPWFTSCDLCGCWDDLCIWFFKNHLHPVKQLTRWSGSAISSADVLCVTGTDADDIDVWGYYFLHKDILSLMHFLQRKKQGHFLSFLTNLSSSILEKQKKHKQHFHKLDSVLTQIAQPQASWGQDVQANGADEGWWRDVGGGIQRHRRRGARGHPVALQTQEEFPGLVHVYCIPLHALYYHRLRGWREGRVKRQVTWTEEENRTERGEKEGGKKAWERSRGGGEG